MYIVLDTETTGVSSFKDRITQLAFIRYSENGEVLFKFNEYIKPNNWVIKDIDWYKQNGFSDAEAYEKGKFFTENNMSTKRCQDLGVDLYDALRVLQDNLKMVNIVVGHNIAFDKRFILSEMKRNGIIVQLLQYKKTYCTMNKSRSIVNALNKYGHKKAPNLTECVNHFKVGGKGEHEQQDENFHDALYDVEMCNEIYRKLIK